MTKNLLELRREIMNDDHTQEEWLALEGKVNEALAQATNEEIQDFVDSGAGESLDMICSAIREMQKNR